MNTENELWDRIVDFTRRQTKTSAQLSRKTELQRDLGIEGDDAFDLVEAFAEEFEVDPGDFDFHRYFGPEGFNPLSLVFSLFRKREKPVGLTLAMLEKAAKLGVWRTTEIEGAARN